MNNPAQRVLTTTATTATATATAAAAATTAVQNQDFMTFDPDYPI